MHEKQICCFLALIVSGATACQKAAEPAPASDTTQTVTQSAKPVETPAGSPSATAPTTTATSATPTASLVDLKVGDPAPALTLTLQDGKSVALASLKGKPVAIYFYPKDDTPGCTKESCDFQRLLPKFKSTKAAVLGISILDEASKAKFAGKYGLKFPLLADEDHAVMEKYGVWQEKSMYGKKYMGVARTTYLIGPDGKVVKRWDGVKVDGHAEEVLAAVQQL